MKTIMTTTQFTTIGANRRFSIWDAGRHLLMSDKTARYEFIKTMLIRFRYRKLNKANKGLLLRFLRRVSGYSKVHIKRLVQQYLRTGKLHCKQRTAVPFTRSIRLLISVHWHKPMSGMKHSLGLRPRNYLSVPIRCLTICVMNDWRTSLLPTCITCATQ